MVAEISQKVEHHNVDGGSMYRIIVRKIEAQRMEPGYPGIWDSIWYLTKDSLQIYTPSQIKVTARSGRSTSSLPVCLYGFVYVLPLKFHKSIEKKPLLVVWSP